MMLNSKIAIIATFIKAYIGSLISDLLTKGQVRPTSSGSLVPRPIPIACYTNFNSIPKCPHLSRIDTLMYFVAS